MLSMTFIMMVFAIWNFEVLQEKVKEVMRRLYYKKLSTCCQKFICKFDIFVDITKRLYVKTIVDTIAETMHEIDIIVR